MDKQEILKIIERFKSRLLFRPLILFLRSNHYVLPTPEILWILNLYTYVHEIIHILNHTFCNLLLLMCFEDIFISWIVSTLFFIIKKNSITNDVLLSFKGPVFFFFLMDVFCCFWFLILQKPCLKKSHIHNFVYWC